MPRKTKDDNPVLPPYSYATHGCHVTLLGGIKADSSIRLPALLHFPDQGSFRISVVGDRETFLGYDARRAGTGYVKVTFPPATVARPVINYRWEVTAIYPKLAGLEKDYGP